MANELSDEQLKAIYAWIDAIPLSRPKKNMARDFSDGVMLAEVTAAYFPQLVDVHNYPAANNVRQKIYNHETLNTKVFKKLGFMISRETIEDIVNAKPGVIEGVLNTLQIKMAKYRERKNNQHSPAPQRESPHQKQPVRKSDATVDSAPSRRQPMAPAQQQRQGGHAHSSIAATVDEEILIEKEQIIRDLQETVEILELKIAKLEQLVRLKDNKIQKLQQHQQGH
jgi:hypothetical protein